MSEQPRNFVTLEAEAQRLSISQRTLRRMIARGELTAYRVGGRLIRLDRREVDALVRKIPAGAA